MPVLSIRQKGDPILRAMAEPVAEFDKALRRLADDMGETMFASDGVGLAAPQVGQSVRLIVVAQGGRAVPPLVMANPVIAKRQDFQRSVEGCLSVPRSQWNQAVSRAKRIVVEYQTLDGEPQRLKAATQFAAVIQHEVDHLDGVLFTDYIRPLSK